MNFIKPLRRRIYLRNPCDMNHVRSAPVIRRMLFEAAALNSKKILSECLIRTPVSAILKMITLIYKLPTELCFHQQDVSYEVMYFDFSMHGFHFFNVRAEFPAGRLAQRVHLRH